MASQFATEEHPRVPERRLLSVLDFHRMAQAGIFVEDDRVELIDGEVFKMAPTGPWHENAVDVLHRTLLKQLFDLGLDTSYRVRVQNAIVIDERTETYPDIAVVREKAEGYGAKKPRAEDTVLIIEVSDSSDNHDRSIKALSYAKSGIPEFWIVSRDRGDMTVLTVPTERGYKSTYFAKDEIVECQAVSGLRIRTKDLL